MIKPLLLAAAGAVSIALAAPAHADDEAFLTVLDKAGFHYTTSAAAIRLRHSVCAELDAGNTPIHAADEIYRSTPRWVTEDIAYAIVGDSIAAYCRWDIYMVDQL